MSVRPSVRRSVTLESKSGKTRISAPAHPSATGIGRVSGLVQYEFKNRLANFSKMNLLIHMKCTNLIPKFQEGTITQKAKKTFKVSKKRSQNFALLDTLAFMAPVRPNDLRQLYQIWHTSSQGSGASSCKILDTWLNFKYRFFPKNAQKMLKKSKIWFFLPYKLFYDHQDHEIWHELTCAPHEHTCQISKAWV